MDNFPQFWDGNSILHTPWKSQDAIGKRERASWKATSGQSKDWRRAQDSTCYRLNGALYGSQKRLLFWPQEQTRMDDVRNETRLYRGKTHCRRNSFFPHLRGPRTKFRPVSESLADLQVDEESHVDETLPDDLYVIYGPHCQMLKFSRSRWTWKENQPNDRNRGTISSTPKSPWTASATTWYDPILPSLSNTMIRQQYILRDLLGYIEEHTLPCAIYQVEDVKRPKRLLVAQLQSLRGLSRSQKLERIKTMKEAHKDWSILFTELRGCMIVLRKGMSSGYFSNPSIFRCSEIRAPLSKYSFMDCSRENERQDSLDFVRHYFENFPKPGQSTRYVVPKA